MAVYLHMHADVGASQHLLVRISKQGQCFHQAWTTRNTPVQVPDSKELFVIFVVTCCHTWRQEKQKQSEARESGMQHPCKLFVGDNVFANLTKARCLRV